MKFLKTVCALILSISLLAIFVLPVYADDAEDTLEAHYSFRDGFEQGDSNKIGSITSVNGSYETEKGNSVLHIESMSGTGRVFAYADNVPEKCEATVISFDFKTDRKTDRCYMDIFSEYKQGQTGFDNSKLSRGYYITHSGTVSFFDKFNPPAGTFVQSSITYDANKWYHLDMWVDYAKREVCYFSDGNKIGSTALTDDSFRKIAGFFLTVDTLNGGANYWFDNLQIVNFSERGAKVGLNGIAVPDGFDKPVTIEYKTDENNLGFNFMNEDASFVATITNSQNKKRELEIENIITNEENYLIDSQKVEKTVEAKKSEKVSYKAKLPAYGFYYLETTVRDLKSGEKLSSKKFQFAKANSPDNSITNSRVGYTDHTGDGHGTEECARKIELMKKQGSSVLRIDVSKYSTSYTDRTFIIDKVHQQVLDECDKNGITALVILSFSKLPPTTPEEYEEWDEYVTSVVSQLKGRKVIYNVWNEYNGAGFNYKGATAHDYVDLLKHTYPIIKSIDPSAPVWGMVISPTLKENGDMDAIDWLRLVMEDGGGNYMDACDIHAYTYSAPENQISKREILPNQTRELLDEFGFKDLPMVCSEMGWTVPDNVDALTSAAYQIRWITYYYNLFDHVDWYVDQVKRTTSSWENGYGALSSWNKITDDEPEPYSAKPMFLSMAFYNKLMAGASFSEIVKNEEKGKFIYKFKLSNEKDCLIVWNAGNKSETIALDVGASSALKYDMYGNETELTANSSGAIQIDISGEPIYLAGDFGDVKEKEVLFTNLSTGINITKGDTGYIQFRNLISDNTELEVNYPKNITESERDINRITFSTGTNPTENEKIHVKVKNPLNGKCYYEYSVPIKYSEMISYSLNPYYFRNGHWQCMMVLKNNKFSGPLSGTVTIKSPSEIVDLSKPKRFENLLPRESKILWVNVPEDFAGAHINLVADIDIDNEQSLKDIESSVYLTAVAKMEIPPKIDGVLEPGEWNKAMPILINNESQVVQEPDWSGPEDLTARVYCQYDADNFYLAAEVQDDVECDNDALGRVWACDSFQFAFSKELSSSAARTEYGIGLVNGEPKVDRYSYMVPRENLNEKDVDVYEGVELKISRAGTTTIYESKFPWSQIYGDDMDMSKENEICFSIMINENDGEGRHGWLEYCSGIGLAKDPGKYISIKLSRKD